MCLFFCFSVLCLQGGNAFATKVGRLLDPEVRRLASWQPARAFQTKAPSTTEQYSRAFQKFKKWASFHPEIIPLPSSDISVAIYLEFLLQSNCSFSSLESAWHGINWAHNLYGFPTPCDSNLVPREARLINQSGRRPERSGSRANLSEKIYIYMYIYTIMYTMCPPGCYHNGFMATPELGHRMYGYTLLDCIVESRECSNCEQWAKQICQ